MVPFGLGQLRVFSTIGGGDCSTRQARSNHTYNVDTISLMSPCVNGIGLLSSRVEDLVSSSLVGRCRPNVHFKDALVDFQFVWAGSRASEACAQHGSVHSASPTKSLARDQGSPFREIQSLAFRDVPQLTSNRVSTLGDCRVNYTRRLLNSTLKAPGSPHRCTSAVGNPLRRQSNQKHARHPGQLFESSNHARPRGQLSDADLLE